MGKIKVAIAGVGNCASLLVQGIEYYRKKDMNEIPGLMHPSLGGYRLRDIEFVAAFDVDRRKVGRDLSEAIFSPPNNTVTIAKVPRLNVRVQKGPVLDGIGEYLRQVIPVDPKQAPCEVSKALRDSGAEILLNYLPVGSYEGARYYADAALTAGCAYINCIPEFLASGEYAKKQRSTGCTSSISGATA